MKYDKFFLLLFISIQFQSQAQEVFWQFSQGTGYSVSDYVGSNDDILNGGVTWVSDRPGDASNSAVSFDGMNDYMSTNYEGIDGATNRRIFRHKYGYYKNLRRSRLQLEFYSF